MPWIETEAMRKLGQLLQQTPKNTGAKGIGPIVVPKKNHNAPLSLNRTGRG